MFDTAHFICRSEELPPKSRIFYRRYSLIIFFGAEAKEQKNAPNEFICIEGAKRDYGVVDSETLKANREAKITGKDEEGKKARK